MTITTMTKVILHIDGDAFFAHELTMNFTPTQFTLDFKNITPRADPRNKEHPSFTLKHNVIMLDTWHVKAMSAILNNVITKYEQEYGRIKKPAALGKAEKRQKKTSESEPSDEPTYFG